MPLKFQKRFTESYVKNNPDMYFVYGDNIIQQGYGGQAMACRGYTNTIGIPTKFAPGYREEDYFSDDMKDIKYVSKILDGKFQHIALLLIMGKTVIFPEDGLGTGLAELDKRAPRLLNTINYVTNVLNIHFGEKNAS